MIIGCGGAGKSTLAKKLNEKTDILNSNKEVKRFLNEL